MMSIYSLFQVRVPPQIVILIVTPIIALILELILLKLGLNVVNAEKRTSFKWILGSIGIQIGIIAFIGLPVILMGIAGEFSNRGPDPGLIIPIIIIGLIIEINLINVLHEPGFGKSILIFILFAIPIGFLVFVLTEILPSLF